VVDVWVMDMVSGRDGDRNRIVIGGIVKIRFGLRKRVNNVRMITEKWYEIYMVNNEIYMLIFKNW